MIGEIVYEIITNLNFKEDKDFIFTLYKYSEEKFSHTLEYMLTRGYITLLGVKYYVNYKDKHTPTEYLEWLKTANESNVYLIISELFNFDYSYFLKNYIIYVLKEPYKIVSHFPDQNDKHYNFKYRSRLPKELLIKSGFKKKYLGIYNQLIFSVKTSFDS
jgi:hypothetical protein